MEHEKLRILLVEDDEDDYLLIKDMLSRIPGRRFALEWADNCEAAIAALRKDCLDICLLDYRLSGSDGMDILKWAKQHDCRVPFIVLTGWGDYTIDLRAMQEGAFDYIAKIEATPSLLERSIRYAIGRMKAEEALRESEERFRFMAENSGDVLYRLRYDSMRYDYLSPSIKILTGYSPEEIDSIGFSSLVLRIETVRKKIVPPALLKERRLAGIAGEHKADYLIRTRSGSFKWLSDHSVPWKDRAGSLVGSIGILADITERRSAEDAILESEKQLRLLSSKLLNVQEMERTRLARNLHDTIGQSLAAVKYGVENALKAKGKTRAKDMALSLEAAVPLLQNLIDSVRTIYMDLRPTILDDFGIVAALEWLCREFRASQSSPSMECRIRTTEEMIPAALKSVIFRISREALDNIAKHSNAWHAILSLETTDSGIELEVSDDGIGFAAEEAGSGEIPDRDGLGICSMRERTRLSGGSFAIRSQEGKGTLIRICWPHGKQPSP